MVWSFELDDIFNSLCNCLANAVSISALKVLFQLKKKKNYVSNTNIFCFSWQKWTCSSMNAFFSSCSTLRAALTPNWDSRRWVRFRSKCTATKYQLKSNPSKTIVCYILHSSCCNRCARPESACNKKFWQTRLNKIIRAQFECKIYQ